jgi:hypothetical protein
MTTKNFKKAVLSLSAASFLTTGLNADIVPNGAHLDLENYSRIIIDFNGSTDGTGYDSTSGDGNFSVRNTVTEDNLTLAFVDVFDANSTIYEISGGKEGGTGNDLNATEAVKKIRGNTQNGLYVVFENNTTDDDSDDTNLSLLKTIADGIGDDLNVTDNAWNLITIPAGVYTNAKEMIKANKATMIWGWDLNSSSEYNWVAYPDRMEPGRGYWVRTRVTGNTGGTLNDIVASDYNLTLLSDVDSAEINTSNFADVVSNMPKKDEWVLLGNAGAEATIVADTGSEDNVSTYWFEDLLDETNNCYFVSIYHWDAANNKWVNDTESGATSTPIPANAGVWVKQRLCDN